MLSEEERQELASFFIDEKNRELFVAVAGGLMQEEAETGETEHGNWEPVLTAILSADKGIGQTSGHLKVSHQRWWYYAAAVVFIIGLSGTLYWQQGVHKSSGPVKLATTADMAPGGNKAILKLANGSSVVLNDTQNGIIGQQGGVRVIKMNSGLLAYQPEQVTATATTVIQYNTLTTPRGGQFRVILPDGSQVWLNAASALKYPTAFAKGGRTVELTGEGYFEIADKADQPFRVKVKGLDVLVLGTHFNINAYDDEPAYTTTLLEGKVKVSGDHFSGILQPREQLQLKSNNDWRIIKGVDADMTVAWKNGLFSFNRADIKTVMRQLARWYDVEVVYDTKTTQQAFVGEIPRNVSLSKALDILRLSDIHFVAEGKTIKIID